MEREFRSISVCVNIECVLEKVLSMVTEGKSRGEEDNE
jgi:hypothetical protein